MKKTECDNDIPNPRQNRCRLGEQGLRLASVNAMQFDRDFINGSGQTTKTVVSNDRNLRPWTSQVFSYSERRHFLCMINHQKCPVVQVLMTSYFTYSLALISYTKRTRGILRTFAVIQGRKRPSDLRPRGI